MGQSRSVNSGSRPKYPIQSVGNALELLLALRSSDRLTVTDAAAHLGVALSTAHRLLDMLAWHEFIVRETGTKAYKAGPALIGVGLAALQSFDLPSVARPHMQRLVAEVDETVNLLILEEASVRFIECVESRRALRVVERVGLRRPAFATSVGKVLLAALEPGEHDRLLPAGEPLPLGSQSVKTRAELDAELERTRQVGYGINLGDTEAEIRAVGVGIRVGIRFPPAGLAVSAPSVRLPNEKIPPSRATSQ